MLVLDHKGFLLYICIIFQHPCLLYIFTRFRLSMVYIWSHIMHSEFCNHSAIFNDITVTIVILHTSTTRKITAQ
jgi:hypothetical protein